MNEIVIQTANLTRRYGPQVSVNAVNMNVPRGSIYGFLGPNGAGKTTTIRMLLGLIRPTSGDVRIFGQELSKHRIPILRRVGSLVESPSYYGHLSGFENLDVFARLLDTPAKRIHEVLETVRLTSAANKAVKGYSLGMKQRLGIATALLGTPELLILDEPTNGLDPAGIHEIRELILDLPRQHGITVLVSSHLLSEIDQMATRVGVINEGRLVFEDNIEILHKRSRPGLKFAVSRPHDALKLFTSFGLESTIEGNFVTVPELDYATTAEVTKTLVLSEISVYRIQDHKSSLEDIFLDLVGTGRSL